MVSNPAFGRSDAPTWALAGIIHVGWLALTWWHAALPAWLLAACGGWLIAWHGSFQHETIHGHPTSRPWLNALLGGVPMSLWFPYLVYRRTHHAHHAASITDPLDDPESRYLSGRAGPVAVLAGRLEAPLLGRLVFGPVIAIGSLLSTEARRAVSRPRAVAAEWIPHLIGVAAVLVWLRACGFDLGRYVLLCVYPGLSLTLLRSYAEHRADPLPGRRVATVEGRGPLALLFLNNNLHAAHHHAPGVAWHELPAFFAAHRETVLAETGGPVYRGYGDLAGRFLLRAHDRLVHPDHG